MGFFVRVLVLLRILEECTEVQLISGRWTFKNFTMHNYASPASK